jgi:glycogen debranching enzyme
MAQLADAGGAPAIAARNGRWAARGLAGLEACWSEAAGQYLPLDRIAGRQVQSPSLGGLIPLFAPIPPDRAATLGDTLRAIGERVRYLVPSHDPRDRNFDVRRYWRGPVWHVCNYLIVDGLRRAGMAGLADRIVADSLALIERSGFAEYYDPTDGAPLGGGHFSWTAAIVLEFAEPVR